MRRLRLLRVGRGLPAWGVYDAEEHLCYEEIECESVEECAEFDDDLITLFFGLVDELLFALEQEHEGFPEGEELLVTYEIRDNQIVNPENAPITDDLAPYQADTASHQQIWVYFASLIPREQRTMLCKFVVFTDGPEETMAAVDRETDNPTRWILAVDIQDAKDTEELTYTLIHEFGHLLTLDTSEVGPDTELLLQLDDERIRATAVAGCPGYFAGDGCSQADSYLNGFYDRFWDPIYDEWSAVDAMEDADAYFERLEAFCLEHQDQFVSDYEATGPEEDIAESWTHFVLRPKPEAGVISGEKVRFFYARPELVRLRAEIISRTYSRLRRRSQLALGVFALSGLGGAPGLVWSKGAI